MEEVLPVVPFWRASNCCKSESSELDPVRLATLDITDPFVIGAPRLARVAVGPGFAPDIDWFSTQVNVRGSGSLVQSSGGMSRIPIGRLAQLKSGRDFILVSQMWAYE
ncbi:MAG TPA: hypothetical protein VMV94_17485 [Phycisphaerae bacterium]|nr:hypothetical protein [Phycisphaerae bacterium]